MNCREIKFLLLFLIRFAFTTKNERDKKTTLQRLVLTSSIKIENKYFKYITGRLV